MRNRLNLGFYSHTVYTCTFNNSHISCGKWKLKHVHLMCENQWGSFLCVTQYVWASATTNEVHFHVTQDIWASGRTNEVNFRVMQHICASARTSEVYSHITQNVWASARTSEVYSHVMQHVWALAWTNEAHIHKENCIANLELEWWRDAGRAVAVIAYLRLFYSIN